MEQQQQQNQVPTTDEALTRLHRCEFRSPTRFWRTVDVARDVRKFGRWRRNSYCFFFFVLIVLTTCTIALAPTLACAVLYQSSICAPNKTAAYALLGGTVSVFLVLGIMLVCIIRSYHCRKSCDVEALYSATKMTTHMQDEGGASPNSEPPTPQDGRQSDLDNTARGLAPI